MANGIYHTGLGIELNLTKPDLGHPEFPGLWETLRADHRPVPERELQCIQCRKAQPDCPEWMFLTERDGRRFASHFTRGIADHDTDNESDEHKAYKERVVKAAELGGFQAEVESRSADGKRRTDVLVKGDSSAVGWEIQLSYATLDSVRNRANLARRDAITPLWATVDPTRDFIDKVPWALMRGMEWRFVATSPNIPIRGGVRTLEFWRCDNRRRPCPIKGRGGCGRLHEEWLRANDVTLDSLVRSSASGDYVPIVLPGKALRRWWITSEDRERFLDNGGVLLNEGDHKQNRRSAPQGEQQARSLDRDCHYGEDSGYRSPPAEVRDDEAPVVTATRPREGTLLDGSVLLDWSSRTHWGGGDARPCRRCGKPAFLVDADGAPMHKTCAERPHSGEVR